MEKKVAGHNFLASDMTIPEIFGDVIGEYVADMLMESEDELEEGEKERYMNRGLEDMYDICSDKLSEIVRDSGGRILDVAEQSAREYLEPLWGPTRRGASRSDERIQAAILRGTKKAIEAMRKGAAEEDNPHWYITKDLVDDGMMNGKGLGINVEGWQPSKNPEKYPVAFRLLDDDGEVYFEGKMSTGTLDAPGEIAFSPLWDFGQDYGCTELQYREGGGEWVGL